MYSVILMTAMTAGAPEVPQWGWKAHNCSGGACSGCYGYSYGYACRGGCSGCSGGCMGCCGSRAGCTGGAGAYPAGAPMPPAAATPPMFGYRTGGMRIYGPDVWGASYFYSGSTPYVPVTPMDEPKKPVPPPEKAPNGAARLILDVPAGAKVMVDGQPTNSTAEVRYFYTPKLIEGQSYFYDVAVEMPGEKQVTRRVYVHANEVVRETFRKPLNSSALASK